MDRIKDALERAEEKLIADREACSGKCQEIGSEIASVKDDIKQKEKYLAALIEDFNVRRSNFDKVQGQLTLLEELKTSINA